MALKGANVGRFIEPLWFGQLAVTAFFAVAFLQSAVDKLVDSQGNLDFLSGHFSSSPLGGMVPLMFWVIAALETITGLCCGVGFILLLIGTGSSLAIAGIELALLSLLCLFFGQRLAKDYPGAAVLAAYFAVGILGLVLFAKAG